MNENVYELLRGLKCSPRTSDDWDYKQQIQLIDEIWNKLFNQKETAKEDIYWVEDLLESAFINNKHANDEVRKNSKFLLDKIRETTKLDSNRREAK